MKRFACHQLYVLPDDCYTQYVIELKDDGKVHAIFPLKEEISGTEWIGGVIVLSPFTDLTLQKGESFSDFLHKAIDNTKADVYAWHLDSFDFVSNSFIPPCNLTRLY